MPPSDPGMTWEQMVVRTIDSMDRKLDEIRAGMVPRPEFEAAQKAIEQRFQSISEDVAKKREDHAALEAKIQAVDDKVDTQESDRHKWAREANARGWFAVASGAIAVIGSAVAIAFGVN